MGRADWSTDSEPRKTLHYAASHRKNIPGSTMVTISQEPAKISSNRRIGRIALMLALSWLTVGPGLCLIGAASLSRADSHALVSVADIEREIQGRNSGDLELLLTRVATMQAEGAVVPFLVDLWEGREDKHPALPWAFVRSEPVRLKIGGTLFISAEMRVPGARINKDELRHYALSFLEDGRASVASLALAVLTPFDDASDVDAIFQVARQERTGVFKSSVVALAQMCNAAAREALLQLEKVVQIDANKEFVRDTRQEFDLLKEERSLCVRP